MVIEVEHLGSSNGDDGSGGGFTCALLIVSKPSGLFCENKSSVESRPFPANVVQGVGGGDAVYKKLYRGGVQVDGGGARDKVEELRHFAVKRGGAYRFHGGDGEVKRGVSLNLLNKATRESRINVVADFLVGWEKS